MKRPILFLSITLFIILVALFVLGWYPIMMVNGNLVSARDFSAQENLLKNSYANLEKKVGVANIILPDERAMALALLNQLVEQTLIHVALTKEVSPDVLRYLLEEKLQRVDADPSLKDATESLYGAPLVGVRVAIFLPQAERDILTSRLFLEGKTFESWLMDAKAHAHVSIFKTGFTWDGSDVVTK